jgi:hypothetical protein
LHRFIAGISETDLETDSEKPVGADIRGASNQAPLIERGSDPSADVGLATGDDLLVGSSPIFGVTSEASQVAGSSLAADVAAALSMPPDTGLIAAGPGVESAAGQSSAEAAAAERPQGDGASLPSDSQVTAGQQPTLDLSDVARVRERVVARMVKDFMSS